MNNKKVNFIMVFLSRDLQMSKEEEFYLRISADI